MRTHNTENNLIQAYNFFSAKDVQYLQTAENKFNQISGSTQPMSRTIFEKVQLHTTQLYRSAVPIVAVGASIYHNDPKAALGFMAIGMGLMINSNDSYKENISRAEAIASVNEMKQFAGEVKAECAELKSSLSGSLEQRV